jgi:Domain of unknown function (DUF4340)
MKKTTPIWFLLAAVLAAAVWLSQKFLQPAAFVSGKLLPGLHAGELTEIQISPAGAGEIEAVRSNRVWQLLKPIAYPAQAAAVGALGDALEKLNSATRLTAAEMRAHKNADADFGFENPQFRVEISAGEQSWHLLVGKLTAPGDQVFVRVVGLDGAFVTDAGWLQFLPRAPDVWRDTALVGATAPVDWIVVTNGAKAMEFRLDPTNRLWRMVRPLAARADGARIAAALQQLQSGRAEKFITDDPRADLSGYGLQPAEIDVWLGRKTNFTAAVHGGKTVADGATQLFARRDGWNTVVTANAENFAAWRGGVNDFRDPHLLALTAPVAEIESFGENHFLLQQRGENDWALAGEKYSGDAENVANFLKLLNSLRVSEFVKDVVTPADLQGFGLAAPARRIVLRGTAGDTNSVLAELLFSNTDPNRVLVKRADEDFVYALRTEDFSRLPEAGWEFRERRIWKFTEADVAQLTLRQNGKTRVLARTGENKWSLAAGQGVINPPAIEETAHRLGELTAAGWVGHDITAPEKYGLNTNNLSLAVQLKSGEKLSVDFGAELPRSQTALAAADFGGSRWVFVFPPVLYQFVATYLTIPADAP